MIAGLENRAPPYVEVQPGSAKNTGTQGGYSWMPGPFGGPDQLYAVFRLGLLAARQGLRLLVRTREPWKLSVGLAGRTSPFLLTRSRP